MERQRQEKVTKDWPHEAKGGETYPGEESLAGRSRERKQGKRKRQRWREA